MDRVCLYATESVSKETHVLLEWRLSTEGLAHFSTTYAGAEHRFAPILSKMSYWGDHDWKVWHFLGDLPVRSVFVDFDFKVTQ